MVMAATNNYDAYHHAARLKMRASSPSFVFAVKPGVGAWHPIAARKPRSSDDRRRQERSKRATIYLTPKPCFSPSQRRVDRGLSLSDRADLMPSNRRDLRKRPLSMLLGHSHESVGLVERHFAQHRGSVRPALPARFLPGCLPRSLVHCSAVPS